MPTMNPISEKIQKLLAIASCEGASDAEKATALHQAARLAEKHAIDIDQLGADASDYAEEEIWNGSKQPAWLDGVIHILTKHFNVRAFRVSVSRAYAQYMKVPRFEVKIFGCAASREVAVYVFTFLSREFPAAAKQLGLKPTVGVFRSMAHGLDIKLSGMNRTKEEQSNALILSNRLKSEFAAISGEFGKVIRRIVDGSQAAFERGREIDIRPGLKGASAPLAIGMRES